MPTQKVKSKQLFIVFVLLSCIVVTNKYVFAADLSTMKSYFLGGNFKAAIKEGEKVLASSGNIHGQLDELYYLLGLSYLKDGNYLRASDIFEIILKEFSHSNYKDEAMLGLGDTYFLRGNLNKAKDYYRGLLKASPKSKLKAHALSRLSQAENACGNTQKSKEYSAALQKEFPLYLDLPLENIPAQANDQSLSLAYVIQVGSFSRQTNARNLERELKTKGYAAFVEEFSKNSGKIYRVRVSNFKSRSEALDAAAKLSGEGYPTKILP